MWTFFFGCLALISIGYQWAASEHDKEVAEARRLREQEEAACLHLAARGEENAGQHTYEEWAAIADEAATMAPQRLQDGSPSRVRASLEFLSRDFRALAVDPRDAHLLENGWAFVVESCGGRVLYEQGKPVFVP